MVQSDNSLRETINGGRAAPPPPKRLPKIEAKEPSRKSYFGMAALGAGGVVVAVAIAALAFTSVESRTSEDDDGAIAASGEAVRVLPDSGVKRAPAPLGLGGRVIRASDEPERPAKLGPEPLRGPEIADEDAPMPLGPQSPLRAGPSAEDLAGPATEENDLASAEPIRESVRRVPAALVVASSNLVWKRIFTEHDYAFTPVHFLDAALWEKGACANRGDPALPAYCELDQSIYLDPEARLDMLGMLAVANEVGHHVQDSLGVDIAPLAGEARERQADCFAGLWAQNDPMAAERLVPGLLARAISDGQRVTLWERARIDAFTQGYVARGPMDCTEPKLFSASTVLD